MRRNSTKPRQQPTSTPAATASSYSSAGGFQPITTAGKMVSTRLMSSTSSSEEMDDGGLVLEQLPPPHPAPTLHQPVTVITRLAVARNYDQQVPPFSTTSPLPQSHPVTVITRLAVARQTMPSTSSSSSSSSSISKLVKANNVLEEVEPTHVLDLPQEILCKIFSYLDFKEVGQIRLVSKRFNEICGYILNFTFSQLTNQMNTRFHTVKASMPRRESARRNHPLACECDIIETCHMRLSLLQMTFGKHIERKHCYFFPGAILDEIYRILRYIKEYSPNLARPFQVTDELFDLSTMAMEYFKDKLEPILPEIVRKDDFFEPRETNKKVFLSNLQPFEMSDDSSSNHPPQTNMVLRKGIRKIKQGMKMYNNQLSVLRSEMRNCKRKSSDQSKQITEQQKVLAEQQKQILEYANRLDENDKKNEEISRKFSTLLQELNKCKTELQYWRSKSPATKCGSCGQRIPVAPPEVYQALINQGINPDDLDPIEDEEENDEISNGNINNADIGEDGVGGDVGEANLSTTSFDSGIGGSNNNSTFEFVLPDETTTAKLMAVNSAKKRHHANNHNHHQQQAEDDCYLGCDGNNCSTDLMGGGEGCPPAKFYSKASTSSAAGSVGDSIQFSVNGSGGGELPQPSATTADVVSLNCIASNETKKARRVQKGGNNGSSSTTSGIFSGGIASSSGRSSKRK